MEIASLYIKGFQGIISFLEEEYYDMKTDAQENIKEDGFKDFQFLFIYGFISILIFFILFSLLVACYYHCKTSIWISSELNEQESSDMSSDIEEQSILTNNRISSEENALSGDKSSNESIFDAKTVIDPNLQPCISITENAENSMDLVKKTDCSQNAICGEISSPFSRQNASSTLPKLSKINSSEKFSSSYTSKQNSFCNAQDLNKYPQTGNDLSFTGDISHQCNHDQLTQDGLYKVSSNDYCNINQGNMDGPQNSSSNMDLSSVSLSDHDNFSTSVSEYLSKTSLAKSDDD